MNSGRYGLSFHHFGLALRSEDAARTFVTGLGYSIGEVISDPLQGVRVGLCRHPAMPTIELVLPEPEKSGPLDAILKKQESSIYHSCFTTRDASASLNAIESDGLQQMEVSAPKPAVLFKGKPVSFHYISGFGLIELIHLGPSGSID